MASLPKCCVRPSPKWLLVLGSGLCFLIADGCTYTFGIFYTELQAVFGGDEGPGVVALLSGMLYGLPQMAGPLVCPLIESVGPAVSCLVGCLCVSASFAVASQLSSFVGLLLTIGLVTSVGLELLYATGLCVVLRHFHRHRGLATGLTVFCGGIGALVFAELYAELEGRYLWRGAMLVEGAIFTHTALAACLYRVMGDVGEKCNEDDPNNAQEMDPLNSPAGDDAIVPEEHRSLNIESVSNPNLYEIDSTASVRNPNTFRVQLRRSFIAMLDKQLWKPVFILYCIISLGQAVMILVPWAFIHSFAVALGSSSAAANHILACMGITYALGQIGFGALADLANAYVLYGFCLLASGTSCFLMGVCGSVSLLLPLGAVFGLVMGGTMALYSLVLLDLVGEERLYAALGVYLPFVGLGNLVGGPLSALLASKTTYETMFMIGGGTLMGLSIFFTPLMVRPVREFKLGTVTPTVN